MLYVRDIPFWSGRLDMKVSLPSTNNREISLYQIPILGYYTHTQFASFSTKSNGEISLQRIRLFLQMTHTFLITSTRWKDPNLSFHHPGGNTHITQKLVQNNREKSPHHIFLFLWTAHTLINTSMTQQGYIPTSLFSCGLHTH